MSLWLCILLWELCALFSSVPHDRLYHIVGLDHFLASARFSLEPSNCVGLDHFLASARFSLETLKSSRWGSARALRTLVPKSLTAI